MALGFLKLFWRNIYQFCYSITQILKATQPLLKKKKGEREQFHATWRDSWKKLIDILSSFQARILVLRWVKSPTFVKTD